MANQSIVTSVSRGYSEPGTYFGDKLVRHKQQRNKRGWIWFDWRTEINDFNPSTSISIQIHGEICRYRRASSTNRAEICGKIALSLTSYSSARRHPSRRRSKQRRGETRLLSVASLIMLLTFEWSDMWDRLNWRYEGRDERHVDGYFFFFFF